MMEIVLEEMLILASDRAAILADMTLVLLPRKQNANELSPQFTLGDKSSFENKCKLSSGFECTLGLPSDIAV